MLAINLFKDDLQISELKGKIEVITHYFEEGNVQLDTTLECKESTLLQALEECGALALDAVKKKVLDFVESRTGYIAPNLFAIVGSAFAAKLMGTTGGLSSLVKMPTYNVQLLDKRAKLATLADSFLAYLKDLSDNYENYEVGEEVENVDDEMAYVEALKYDELDGVSNLQKSQCFLDIM
eukprot:Gb_37310 [translate_table: standard]